MVVDLRDTLAWFDPVGAFQRKRSSRQKRNARLRDLLFRLERLRSDRGIPFRTKGEMHSRQSTGGMSEGGFYDLAENDALHGLEPSSRVRQVDPGGMIPRRIRRHPLVRIRQPVRTVS